MSYKWAVGAVMAVVSAVLVLPGVASAHHPELDGSVNCNDGSFNVSATYFGGTQGNNERTIEMFLDDGGSSDQYDGANNTTDWNPLVITQHTDTGPGPDFEWHNNGGTSNDHFHADDNYTGPFVFFEVDGTYYDLESFVQNDIDIRADINSGQDAYIEVRQTNSEDLDFDECVHDYCVNGDTGVDQLQFESTATGDCDPVRLCVDGESMTVTEFDAESLDGEKGSCTPGDLPPPNVPGLEEEPALEAVVEQAVAEVSPVIEVVALPSAGQGDVGGVTYTWVAILGLAVVAFGGATALMARPRK
jgi:hypothetical protein